MLIPHHLPLAALEDLIRALVPIIMLVLWAAGHLMNAKPKAKPPVRPRPAPPNPPAALPGQGGKPATLEDSLRREVEEFMRRAQARPGQQVPPQQSQPQQRRQTSPQQASGGPGSPRRESRPSKPPASPTQPAVRRLTDAPGSQTTAQSPEPKRSMSSGTPTTPIGQAVAQHLSGTQNLGAHAQKLGSQVAHADERIQEHIQEKFTHKIGSLQHADDKQRSVVRSPAAQELFNLLAKPGGMRQIVLASEILRRPEDRWAPAARPDS